MLDNKKWIFSSKNILNKKNKIFITFFALLVSFVPVTGTDVKSDDRWPDGTPISSWFSDISRVNISHLKRYVITDYGVIANIKEVQTEKIQSIIDLCAHEGGGVIVFPNGTFVSGSLFFKPKTHLLLEEGGELKGSDRIKDFQIVKTRMEGQTLNYFAALVNADHVDCRWLYNYWTRNYKWKWT